MIDKIVIATPCSSAFPEWQNEHISRRGNGFTRCAWTEQSWGFARRTTEKQGPMLVLEASLPKMILGHNVIVLTLEESALALRELVAEARALTSLDLPPVGDWAVRGVELCHVWELDNPQIALSALQSHVRTRGGDHTLRTAAEHGGLTLDWGAKQWRARVYCKGGEVRAKRKEMELVEGENVPTLDELAESADRTLRFEVFLKGIPLCKWLSGNKSVRSMFGRLEQDGHAELERRWAEAFGHIEWIGFEEVAKRLFEVHGETKARHLLDSFVHISTVGETVWAATTRAKPHVLRDLRKGLSKAGVTLGRLEPFDVPRLDARKYLRQQPGFPLLTMKGGKLRRRPFVEVSGVTLRRPNSSDGSVAGLL